MRGSGAAEQRLARGLRLTGETFLIFFAASFSLRAASFFAFHPSLCGLRALLTDGLAAPDAKLPPLRTDLPACR
eukprot:COSAG06_NODE_2308_length_7109_cov_7.230385_2_plen_74_part_00